MTQRKYFQDFMPGNVCFGCGAENPDGLQIKSFWDGEEAVCIFHSEPKYHGWEKVMNGGILATLIDCHCMGTAMAAAYREEGRRLDSTPYYRYATAEITVRYLKPTPNDKPVELHAQVQKIQGRRTWLTCEVFVEGVKTAEAEAVGVRVLEGTPEEDSIFQ
ncbi:MAG: PaaI family thioesterase [Anaerolineales bacterium]|jgi:acyl-coenzyme A thioesterase PaaI-like protein